jgi:hypothetical protein
MILLVSFSFSCSKKSKLNNSSKSDQSISFARQESGLYKINGISICDANFELDRNLELYFLPTKINNDPSFDYAYVLYHKPVKFYFGVYDHSPYDESIRFINFSIDKSIEWSATAKSEKIMEFRKDIPTESFDKGMSYRLISSSVDGSTRFTDIYFMTTLFFIVDDGKGYLGIHMARQGSSGQRFYCFRDEDLPKLKEIFSEEFRQKIFDAETEYQNSRKEQDSKFK